MKQQLTLSFLSVLALLSSCGLEGADQSELEYRAEPATAMGNALLPLTATVHGVSYRLSGRIDVDALSPLGVERIHSQQLDLESGSMMVLSLPIGAYDISLQQARLFRGGASGESEVPFTSNAQEVVQRVVVSENSATNVAWWFEAADTLVPLDPCFVHPDVLACASGDLDGDGVANGVECSNPMACVDTDGDGVADASDTDSDDDLYTDGFDGAPLDPCVPNAIGAACTDVRSVAHDDGRFSRRLP